MIAPRRWPPVSGYTLALLLILAVGAVLRFYHLGLVEYGRDSSYPTYDAVRLLDGHILLLAGQYSSVFIDNPPLMDYLHAIPLLIWRSPWAVYLPIVALNTLAVAFVYLAVSPLLGNAVALLAAALFAVNPWVIHFSRMAWPPALVPFLTAVIAWGLWPTLATDRRSVFPAMTGGLAAIAMMLTSIPAWGVLVQLAALAPLSRHRIPRRVLLISGLVFLACLVPFALGLAMRPSENLQGLSKFAALADLHLTREGLDHALRFVTGRDYDWVWARSETAEFEVRRRLSLAVDLVLKLAVLAGVLFAVRELWQGKEKRRTAMILLTWWGIPILLTSVAVNPVHIHYLQLSLPAGHALAAWGLAPLTRRRLRWLLLPLLVAVSLVFGLNLLRAEEIVAAHPAKLNLDGWSLGAAARLGATIRDLLPNSGGRYPRRIVAPGEPVYLSGLSATYLDLVDDLDYPDFVLLPGQDPLLYVLMNSPAYPEVLGPQVELFTQRSLQFADDLRVDFARVMPYSRESALALPDVVVDWSSDAGLTLLGYSLGSVAQPGQPIRFTVYWRVDELLPQRSEWRVEPFYRLDDLSGNRLAGTHKHGLWARRWQLGDIYVERVDITPPPDLTAGEYQIRIRLLEPSGRAFQFHAPNGPTDALVLPISIR